IEQVGATSDIAIRNLNRAAELIGSFKQVAVDQTSAQRRKFDLAEVVDEIVVMMQPSLKRTPYRIEEAVPAGLVLDSYPGALGQVLTNLINNAVLHGFAGRDHGVITITAAAAAPDSVQLTVQDDGCGIPADRQARIFDPFYTTRLGQGGSGLGLHISHTAVTHILGGTLMVASTPGAGAVFTLLLPRQAPSANPAHVDDAAAANGEHQ
ncbi:MAG: HAMP domain-containing sensor histidine kinase, partial [Rhodocyclaceae bacterium]|nr:HAMP domain-containing sensor histidine kinase [Rhodocyclaceae bacterium]